MLAKFKKNHVEWLAGAHGYLSFLASKAKAYIEGSPATQPHSRVSFDARPRVNSDAHLLTLHLGLPWGAAGAMSVYHAHTNTQRHAHMHVYRPPGADLLRD